MLLERGEKTMNEDKIIADYIRTRYPQMLCTTDFTMYKFGAQVGSAFRCLVDSFNKSYNSLTEKSSL